MDTPDIWVEELGPSTRLFYRSKSRFIQKVIYVLTPFLLVGLVALLDVALQTGNAIETITICAIAAWLLWLVYRFHEREYVFAMTFEPGVLKVNGRRFDMQGIMNHGRSEMGGDVVIAGAPLPRNFIVGPHLFIAVEGRQIPITPPMKSEQVTRLHRHFDALLNTYQFGAPSDPADSPGRRKIDSRSKM